MAKKPTRATGAATGATPRRASRTPARQPAQDLPSTEASLRTLLASPAGTEFLRAVATAIGPAGRPATAGAAGSRALAAAAAAVAPLVPLPQSMLSTSLDSVASSALETLETMPMDVETSMDPRLQLAIANRRSGKRGSPVASVGEDEVAVVARVASVDDWIALPDVIPGSTVGKTPDNSWIVTGRLPIERVEAVRADPTVRSLKASQPMHPELVKTIEAMQVTSLPAGVNPKGGTGVVVGIVDFGCDFMHENFRLSNGKTRLLALWHQAGVSQPNSPFGYGRLYSTADINAALATANPYNTLGYGPPRDRPGQSGTHGTHVMDIAAGNGRGSGQPGVAPKADLIFVEASSSDIAWDGAATLNQSFGDSVQLLEAVRFIFDTAGDRPCVVNLSLGTNGGPHDGTSLVEQGLDALVNEKPNRAVVIAASNSQEDRIHTSGRVPATGTRQIVWRQRNAGGGEFELWYPGNRRLEVTLVAANGTSFGPVAPGANLPLATSNGQIAIFISSRLGDPNNNDNVIGIWLAAGLTSADWTVRLRSTNNRSVDYHAWLERDDNAQSSFTSPVPTHTLGSISTGRDTVSVGSYDAHKPTLPLSSFSSSGPTRDGREKPEVSAPGHQVIAARSRTGTGVTRKSGTSMAAPAVTGLIALIYAEALRQGVSLPIAALRTKLLGGVLKNPPATAAGVWDPRYGVGRTSSKSI